MKQVQVKLRAGKYRIPVTLEISNDRIYFLFRYNAGLIDEIKTAFEGRKYHGFDDPPRKVWSAPITQRNIFQLQYLQGNNPYARYEESPAFDLVDKLNHRNIYAHQREMIAHGLVTQQFIWACEMGTGKTLAAIILMELAGTLNNLTDWYWIGPKSALRAVHAEFHKWGCKIVPQFYTYERLKRVLEEWPSGRVPPQGVIFDECVRLKTPTAQRSKAGKHLANSMRHEHKNPIIGLLSGAPAPKSPADWWHQCEIACPGFVREKDIHTFKQRLGVFSKEDGAYGTYSKLETWLDDENKCKKCGLSQEEHISCDCTFEPSVNEVAKLYRRMKGLVLVKLKKECLDLPDKIFEIVEVQPTQEVLNAAKLIANTSRRAIEALTLLRELSDGFQYTKRVVGKEQCPLCHGTGEIVEYFDPNEPDFPADLDLAEQNLRNLYNDEYEIVGQEEFVYQTRVVECYNCNGSGESDKLEKSIIEVPCPKDDVLREQLDLHKDIGRFVTYGGFTASVDRIIKICQAEKWHTIRADGRGWFVQDSDGAPRTIDPLELFSNGQDNVVFVGQPSAAGMGLNLTASPTILHFSNTFSGDARIQADDRIHRIGMDVNRGARIIDIIHLPTDRLVLDNLIKKKNLQHMSMTGIGKALA